jgi:hypothetical protein
MDFGCHDAARCLLKLGGWLEETDNGAGTTPVSAQANSQNQMFSKDSRARRRYCPNVSSE